MHGQQNIKKTRSVFWLSLKLLSETYLILRRTQPDMIITVYRSACKVPVIVVVRLGQVRLGQVRLGCNETKIFWTDFSKNTQNTKFHQNLPADGQDEANSRFSQFCYRRLQTICTASQDTVLPVRQHLPCLRSIYSFSHLCPNFPSSFLLFSRFCLD